MVLENQKTPKMVINIDDIDSQESESQGTPNMRNYSSAHKTRGAYNHMLSPEPSRKPNFEKEKPAVPKTAKKMKFEDRMNLKKSPARKE